MDSCLNETPRTFSLGRKRKLGQGVVADRADDHVLIRVGIEKLNQATLRLAEIMMHTAVRTALKGTEI